MKKTFKDYIKIVLTITIIVGMFMPYVYGVLPIDVLFENTSELETLFALTIPILVTIPFLLMLIFERFLKDSFLKVLKPVFLLLYIFVFIDYGHGFYDSYDSIIFNESIEFITAMVLSLTLMLLNLKFSKTASEELQGILLAIIAFPILFYFVFFVSTNFSDFNYGGYIISGSFFVLYIMAILNMIKNRNFKNQ